MNCLGAAGVLCTFLLLGQWTRADAEQNCQLGRYASLDLRTDPEGRVYVPVEVNAQPANLLVDTGGIASILTRSTVERLALNTEPISGYRYVRLSNGFQPNEMALADEVQLGSLKASHMHFLIVPDNRLVGEETGMLAPDILINYDVEFDFAKSKFNLFSPEHCAGEVVYWTRQPYAQDSFVINHDGHILLPAQLDGKPIQAMFDTGAARSQTTFESVRDLFSWNDKSADLKVTDHRKDGSPSKYQYPFHTLTIIGVAIINPDIVLNSVEHDGEHRIAVPAPILDLGMNVLRQLHVYISYRERNIYITSADAR